MMQEFVQRYEKEEEKQELLLAVDATRNILRKSGRKSSKSTKAEMEKSMKALHKSLKN